MRGLLRNNFFLLFVLQVLTSVKNDELTANDLQSFEFCTNQKINTTHHGFPLVRKDCIEYVSNASGTCVRLVLKQKYFIEKVEVHVESDDMGNQPLFNLSIFNEKGEKIPCEPDCIPMQTDVVEVVLMPSVKLCQVSIQHVPGGLQEKEISELEINETKFCNRQLKSLYPTHYPMFTHYCATFNQNHCMKIHLKQKFHIKRVLLMRSSRYYTARVFLKHGDHSYSECSPLCATKMAAIVEIHFSEPFTLCQARVFYGELDPADTTTPQTITSPGEESNRTDSLNVIMSKKDNKKVNIFEKFFKNIKKFDYKLLIVMGLLSSTLVLFLITLLRGSKRSGFWSIQEATSLHRSNLGNFIQMKKNLKNLKPEDRKTTQKPEAQKRKQRASKFNSQDPKIVKSRVDKKTLKNFPIKNTSLNTDLDGIIVKLKNEKVKKIKDEVVKEEKKIEEKIKEENFKTDKMRRDKVKKGEENKVAGDRIDEEKFKEEKIKKEREG